MANPRPRLGIWYLTLLLSVASVLVVILLDIRGFVSVDALTAVKSVKPNRLWGVADVKQDVTKTFQNLTEYQRFDYLLKHGHSLDELKVIKKVLAKEELDAMCRHLPTDNLFSTGPSSFDELSYTETRLFHLILLYPEISAKHLCVVEGLINHINVDSRKKDVRLIIWISSQDHPVVKDNDEHVFESLFDSAEFEVEFKFLDVADVMKGTRLDAFYNCMTTFNLDLGKNKKQNIGNAVRLAVLKKLGGFYLDWDFVISGNILDLKPGIGLQNFKSKSVNNAAMKFDKGSQILDEIISQFVENYDGNTWGNNGPYCLRMTFEKRVKCEKKSKVDRLCLVNGKKEKIQFWTTPQIYPIPFKNYQHLVMPVSDFKDIYTEKSVMMHLWNHKVAGREVRECRKKPVNFRLSTIGRMREKHCPIIFEHLLDNGCDF